MKRLTLSSDACVETLALLIIMAHADGELDDKEKEGVRAAAGVLNLTKELRDRVDALLKAPIPVDQILVEHLKPKERAFAFVAATWMSGVDANIDPKETATLDEIAKLFDFDEARKKELVQLARDLEPGRKPDTSWSNELLALFKAIPARLEGTGDVEVVFDGPGMLWT